jgi:ABC-2 type transport system permease protein
MLEIARYEAEKRLLGTVAVTVGLALFAALFLAIAPDIIAEVDLDTYAEAFPEALQTAFGIQTLGSLEGFLAVELYQFGWVLLLGLYFAYAAGGTVAGDLEHNRIGLLLSTPISRSRLVVEKFLALLPGVVLVNVVVAAVVYAGAALIGEPLALSDVLAVHALSVPYLLFCAALGLLFSVTLGRESRAQRAGLTTVFGLFMIDSVVSGTDYEFLSLLSPTRYYSPTDVLVDGTYDLVGTAVLTESAALLVVASVLWFRRRDL